MYEKLQNVPSHYCTATKHLIDHITCINRRPLDFLSIPFYTENAIDLYLSGRSMVQSTEWLKARVAARRWGRAWRRGAQESRSAAAVAAVRAGAAARGSPRDPSTQCLASSPVTQRVIEIINSFRARHLWNLHDKNHKCWSTQKRQYASKLAKLRR